MIASLLRSGRRLRRNTEGAAAIEFAFIGAPLMMLIAAMLETAAVTAAGLVLDMAVDNAARNVMVGQVQAADVDQAGFRKMICEDVDSILSCQKLKIDLRTYDAGAAIPADAPRRDGQIDDRAFCFDPGRQGAITVLRVYYEWPWIAAFLQRIASDTDGKAVLVSMSAFMNEPFGSTASTKATCT